ncbi:hypothetical protein N197_03995 [Helicobacter pylori UM023]|nr:hypothetical protein N197_03995 [Helicobacter pylori UM023]
MAVVFYPCLILIFDRLIKILRFCLTKPDF